MNAMVSGAAVLAGSAAGAVAWALTAPDARARWADAPPDGFNGINEWFEVVRWVIPASTLTALVAALIARRLVGGARVWRGGVPAARLAGMATAAPAAGVVLGGVLVGLGPVVPIVVPAAVVAAGAWGLARPREPLTASA